MNKIKLLKFLKFSFYILITIVLLASFYWFFSSKYIESYLLKQNNFSFESSSVSGYPFHFDINIEDVIYNKSSSLYLKKINLNIQAWRFNKLTAYTDELIVFQVSNTIAINVLPKNLTLDILNHNQNHYELEVLGKNISLSENYTNTSFEIDNISGTIKYLDSYDVDIITKKGNSTLNIKGKLNDHMQYLDGKLEFRFSNPRDIINIFKVFGVNIEENPITNLLIYRGKIDLVFEDGLSFLGPLPIGTAPRLK